MEEQKKKLPTWTGNIDCAIWQNDDGSLYLKIGNTISVKLNKNQVKQ